MAFLRHALWAVLIFGLLPQLLWSGSSAFAQQSLPTEPLVIESGEGRHRFTVEVARTDEERRIGLMHRRSMAADHGMLFDFITPRPVGMWMKNTFIPLDMLFIKSNGRIANIAQAAPHSLETVPSRGRVLGVLELNAGTARRLGLAAGDLVRHPMFGTAETTDGAASSDGSAAASGAH